MAKGSVVDSDKDWEADNDCRTLIEAQEIKADKKRMKAAMVKAKEKMKALKNVHEYGEGDMKNNPGKEY